MQASSQLIRDRRDGATRFVASGLRPFARKTNLAPLLLVLALLVQPVEAATISQDFNSNPIARGWQVHGDASLFQWNAGNQNLEVTWDSSRTNSYFWLSLGNILSRNDDFAVSFDLRLRDITIGISTNKPYTFEIAVGFLSMTNAVATNFFRGAGHSAFGPRNLVEFAYFPDSGFGATFAPTIATSNNVVVFNSSNHPLEITPDDLFQVSMAFSASNRTLRTAVLKNGAPYGLQPGNVIHETILSTSQDFRVDALAIMSYSDAVQVGPREWWGSVLAHGTVDNLAVTMPGPPVAAMTVLKTNNAWTARFVSRTNWSYTLERSADLVRWSNASPTNSGTGGLLMLQDKNSATGERAFYRVRAEKP